MKTQLGETRITDGAMDALGLPSYENGYWSINDDITVDCEGHVRVGEVYNRIYICPLYSIEEIKQFIDWVNR